jgi:hypothetical protein
MKESDVDCRIIDSAYEDVVKEMFHVLVANIISCKNDKDREEASQKFQRGLQIAKCAQWNAKRIINLPSAVSKGGEEAAGGL